MEIDLEYMELLLGHKYRFMMMTGEVLEGTITEPRGAYNTFHMKCGRTTKQVYYWDIDYAYPQELNNAD